MDVSIIIPCYNEEKNIRECLESLIKQGYEGNYEIIVVDGNSTDRTQAIIKKFTGLHSNISLVIEYKKGTAAGRNAGVKAARYEYIAFIDADCQAPKRWLSLLVENYKNAKTTFDNVVAVGGSNIIPEDAHDFLKAIGIILDSYIGSFGSTQGRKLSAPTLVTGLSTVNVLYEKKAIVEAGYFDESLKSEAEDADLNYRLFRAGKKFMYIPYSFVWHRMRTSPILWMKNMFRYGKGRARLLKRYPGMWNITFLLPLFFIVAMTLSLFGPLLKILYLPLLYFPFIVLFSLYQCKVKKSSRLLFVVVYSYIIHHFAYAFGEVYGLVNHRVK